MAKNSITKFKYKRNDLAADFLRSILDYNSETGIFIWKHRDVFENARATKCWNKKFPGKVAGRKGRGGYWEISINARRYLAHRLAWIYVTGKWPTEQIDHINLDKAENRIANLREATPEQNQRNMKMFKTNKSGFKGVSFHKHSKRYKARISINKRVVSLGYYKTPEDAAVAVATAIKKHHGEFCREK